MSGVVDSLHTVEHTALRARNATPPDAPGLVAAWPRVATAADDVRRSLPEHTGATDHVIERIALDARSLRTAAGRNLWPADATPDPALHQVAVGLESIARRDDGTDLTAGEVDEAHRVIASVLWIGAQHVSQAARDHSFDLRFDRRNLDERRAAMARLAKHTARRFNAVEQLAAGAAHGAVPIETDGVAGQLRQSIATWDLEAHRALLEHRSTSVLHVLAHHQAVTGKSLQACVARATETGAIDAFTSGRLAPVLNDSSRSWTDLQATAAEFSFATTAAPETFIRAATDLDQQFTAAVRMADPDDHREMLGALSSHLASSVSIAAATIDLIGTGELRAPARAVNRALKSSGPAPGAAVVDPVAIHRGLSIPLPDQARSILAEPAVRVVRDADEAVNRGAGLDVLYRAPASRPAQVEASRPARPQAPSPSMGHDTGPAPGPSI